MTRNRFSLDIVVGRLAIAVVAAFAYGWMFAPSAHAAGNALNGKYAWKYTCQHCHGTPQPNSSAAFSDYDKTANPLSVYASDPVAITKAANEGYIVPEGNVNDKVDPGANTNDPMGTWSGMAPNRLGVGRIPTQYALDFSAYFATFFDPPEAPASVNATPGNGSATVSFSASRSDLTITSYTVTAQPGNIRASGIASPIVVTGLSNGKAYTFTVAATSNAGTSKMSVASKAVTPSVSVARSTAPKAAATLGVPAVAAAVKAPLPVVPVPIPSTGKHAAPSAPTVVATQQPAATARVRPVPVTTAPVFNAPIIKYVRARSAKVKVYFEPPPNGKVTGYTVTILANGKPTGITAKGTTSPITVSGLTNGNDYTTTVTAHMSAGRNEVSPPSHSFTPLHILGD